MEAPPPSVPDFGTQPGADDHRRPQVSGYYAQRHPQRPVVTGAWQQQFHRTEGGERIDGDGRHMNSSKDAGQQYQKLMEVIAK
jgi:hypothetical protein